jgi:hypothetical protein
MKREKFTIQKKSAPARQIPNVLILEILKFLVVVDLARASRINHAFNDEIKDPSIWLVQHKHLIQRGWLAINAVVSPANIILEAKIYHQTQKKMETSFLKSLAAKEVKILLGPRVSSPQGILILNELINKEPSYVKTLIQLALDSSDPFTQREARQKLLDIWRACPESFPSIRQSEITEICIRKSALNPAIAACFLLATNSFEEKIVPMEKIMRVASALSVLYCPEFVKLTNQIIIYFKTTQQVSQPQFLHFLKDCQARGKAFKAEHGVNNYLTTIIQNDPDVFFETYFGTSRTGISLTHQQLQSETSIWVIRQFQNCHLNSANSFLLAQLNKNLLPEASSSSCLIC